MEILGSRGAKLAEEKPRRGLCAHHCTNLTNRRLDPLPRLSTVVLLAGSLWIFRLIHFAKASGLNSFLAARGDGYRFEAQRTESNLLNCFSNVSTVCN